MVYKARDLVDNKEQIKRKTLKIFELKSEIDQYLQSLEELPIKDPQDNANNKQIFIQSIKIKSSDIKILNERVMDLCYKTENVIKNLQTAPEDSFSSYAIVSFKTYSDCCSYIQPASALNAANIKNELLKGSRISSYFPPDPYDINWDNFGDSYTCCSRVLHLLMWICFGMVVPALNFVLEYKVSKYISESISS
jgi:Cytosolic domain of 10TM putative phosphate transporter